MSKGMIRSLLAIAGLVAAVAFFSIAQASAGGRDQDQRPAAGATKGQIRFEGDRLVEVPDYVRVLDGRTGQPLGYVKASSAIFDANNPPSADAAIQTVWDWDLKNIIGHMYPNVGFVPLGSTPQEIAARNAAEGYFAGGAAPAPSR